MTPRQFYKANLETDRERLNKVVKAAGTTFENFQQIANFGGSCSPRLANNLEIASAGDMTRDEILFADDYEDDDA